MKYLYLFVFIIISSALQAHVDLDHPSGGEVFQAGDTLTIVWQEAQTHNTMGWDLFFSEDGGATWEAIQIGLPYVKRSHDWIIPDMTTSAAKIMVVQVNEGEDYSDESGRFTIEGSTTSVSMLEKEKYHLLKLEDPYPNPISDRVIINYSIYESSHLTIDVVGLNGEFVSALVNDFRMPGDYQIIWLAEDIPSGIYFLQIHFGSERFIRKLIVSN